MTRWRRLHQGIRSLVTTASHVNTVASALSATVLLSACALPVEGLWPTSPDSPARTIFVSLDTWHAMTAFSESEQPAASNEQEDPQARFSSPPSYQLSAIRHSLFVKQKMYRESFLWHRSRTEAGWGDSPTDRL